MKIPVLIAHGQQDDTVEVKQGRAMVDALTKARADVASVFYQKSGHGFSDSAEMEDFLKRLEEFLQKHNPAEG
jgi:dipeptidyl aminopeptidase/acylaminoacyl peptidase